MSNTKICPNTSFAEIRGKLCNNMMYLLKAKSNKEKQQLGITDKINKMLPLESY
jgi:hypothetical protein